MKISLAPKVIKGDVRATAQLIRRIDDGDRDVFDDLAVLYKHSGRAHIVGFTGSPGVGKSTLVDRVVTKYREDGKTVGILAIDPTSPFTGGAILGDRIRMQKHFLDEGVFIRSMATRGKFGGLTRSTADAMVVLDAMGKDVIVIETVGVGQDEVDIANSAHTTVLVTIPGMGDDIQAIKAGLMEIGDIFVVNKADREGAGKTIRELNFMLHMSSERYVASGWVPPVIDTIAPTNQGIDGLYETINRHREHLFQCCRDELIKKEETRVRNQLMDLLKEGLMETALQRIGGIEGLNGCVKEIVNREKDPYGVTFDLLKKLLGG
ncbi:MAG: methylmalonyl Co-A mutase-associated GTPase MeaB [Desulfomonile tiedjei]|uniref:Methylmalonyl Co-A mutase-associated GTPase MeaB n=1 Tax=Desulfomonile tiedjei TaxID=2358 RepID=A0A9D6V241_9BACT|nr:methylmalonyl Co-A mutase-associated GTPase MeaB [Desulfomonile tiedjei]